MKLQTVYSGLSDVGLKRTNNEDAFLCAPELGLFAVADGMGGHQGGEVAAELAISGLQRAVAAAPAFAYESEPSLEGRQEILTFLLGIVNEINARIYDTGRERPDLRGMGCTLDVVLVRGQGLFLAHVGDSRVYGRLGETLYQLTEDHTLTQSLISSGALSPEEARAHPQGGQLMRALGIYPKAEVDTLFLDLSPGDTFLLCSDGIHGLVETSQIDRALQQQPQAAVEQLIRLALERGGRDNATAVFLQVVSFERCGPLRVGSYETLQAMTQSSLFAGFSAGELWRIQRIASVRLAQPGEALFVEMEPCSELCLILDGAVTVSFQGVQIGQAGPGDPVGEMTLHPEPAMATYRAERPTHLLVFPLSEVQRLMQCDTALAAKLAMNCLKRLRGRLIGLAAATSRLRAADKASH